MILKGLQSIISIFIMIFTGIVLTHKGWFHKEISHIFSKIIMNIAIPSLIIFNLLSSYNKNDLVTLFSGIIIPVTGIIISYIISCFISILVKIKKERRGLFQALFTFSNTMMVGLPVNISLFGDKSIPLVTIYYLANTIVFWTLGIYGIKKGNREIESISKKFLKLKRIISPPLLAFTFVIILIYFNLSLPRFILSPLEYMGSLTTPLSMLVIGINIYYTEIKNILIDKSFVTILIGKFIITPAVFFLLLNYLSKPVLMTNVFVIEAGMPVMATIAIVGQEYNVDYDYATLIVMFSIFVSFFMIPIYMLLLG